MESGRMESGKLLGGMVSFCAARGGRSSNPVNLVNPVENALRVLHNPLARLRGASFPMIGNQAVSIASIVRHDRQIQRNLEIRKS